MVPKSGISTFKVSRVGQCSLVHNPQGGLLPKICFVVNKFQFTFFQLDLMKYGSIWLELIPSW